MKTTSRSFLLIAITSLLLPSLGQAHTGSGSTLGFSHGAVHPLAGLDHLLAMLAVGLWAAQSGGRAFWAVPLSFVSVMVLGGLLGMAGIALPLVESGIAGSVLILGVLIAASVRLPLPASMAVVGLFALCHGHAHGTEIPAGSSALGYALGFVFATALLHGAGMGLGVGMQRLSQPLLVRCAGAALALAGIGLLLA